MKPICVQCCRFYRPDKNGIWFLEGRPVTNDAPPGKEHAEQWRPYKLWHGDRWRCDGCGHLLISGVGHQPLREHYMPDFEEACRAVVPILQVNDC